TGCLSKQHGIEIVDDDACSPSSGTRPLAVGLETGADNLTQFFHRRFRATVGGMAKFFQLDSESAAALDRNGQVKLGADIKQGSFQESDPTCGGIWAMSGAGVAGARCGQTEREEYT